LRENFMVPGPGCNCALTGSAKQMTSIVRVTELIFME
jgi:hypothetical protein